MSNSQHGSSSSHGEPVISDHSIAEQIDDACDRFEAAWKSGPQPQLEDALAEVETRIRPALFSALLPVEIELRRKAGEMPDAKGYQVRFPAFKELVATAFQHQAAMSQTFDKLDSRPTQSKPSHLQTNRVGNSPDSSPPSPSNNSSVKPSWPTGRMCESVADFQQALLASGIIDERQLGGFLESNQETARTSNISQFATALKKAGLVTKYQAENVYAGRGAALVMGNYVILDKLGQGGMGMVMKARHRKMGRLVALKLLPREAMKSADAVKRFQREVQAAAQLIHPNIVTAFDADEAKGQHYLAMEMVEGPDLSAVIKERGPQPLEVAIDWIGQAAKGLAFAHVRGIVHRDIKPSNLLLAKDGTIKVLDMGLARIERESEGEDAHEPSLSSMTNTGQVMGTIDYMAPEQALDTRKADARADIYSLGCTLFRVLSGTNLFEAGSVMAKLIAHREQPIPSLTEAYRKANVKSSLSPESVNAVLSQMEAIFQRMVAKRPEDRFQSMNEVVAALDGCLSQPGRAADVARVTEVATSSRNSGTHVAKPQSSLGHPTTDVAVNEATSEFFADMMDADSSATAPGYDDPTVLFDSTSTGSASSDDEPRRTSRTTLIVSCSVVAIALIAAVVAKPLLLPPAGTTKSSHERNDQSQQASSPGAASTSTSTMVESNTAQPVIAWTEREAAAWIIEQRGIIRIQPPQGDLIEVRETDQLKNLDALRIDSIQVTGRVDDVNNVIARSAGCSSIRNLNLSGTELTDDGLKGLEDLSSLTSLDLRGCSITDAGLKSVGKLVQLTYLGIGESRDRDAAVRITDAGLLELRSLSQLETLRINSRHMTDEGLAGLIEYCPDLVSLTIERAPLKDSVIESLAKLKHLSVLGLIETKLTDGAVDSIQRAKLPRLKELNVQGTQISPDGIRRLQASLPVNCRVYGGDYSPKRNAVRAIVQVSGRVKINAAGSSRDITSANFNDLPNEFTVQQIDLRNVRPLSPELLQLKEAAELVLADSAISPHDVRQLPSLFPVLTVLDLSGTAVTDRELTAIASLTSLQRIDLARTKVTPTGIERLKKANPTCEVKSSGL